MSPYLFEIYSEIFMNEMIHLGLVSKSGGIDETRLANNLGFGWSIWVHGGIVSKIWKPEKQVLIRRRKVPDQEFCF